MDPKNDMAKAGEDKAKRNRAAYHAKASSDFYGGAGWMVGLFITLFIATQAIWLLLQTATRSTFNDRLQIGISVAWWFNPLSLGALGYIASNIRAWRFWTVFALLVWAGVNVLVSAAIVNESARILIVNGLLLTGYILFGLFVLYIQLRVFLWAAGREKRDVSSSVFWAGPPLTDSSTGRSSIPWY